MSLDIVLAELIATDLNVSPRAITTELIHKWRESYLYHNAQHDYRSIHNDSLDIFPTISEPPFVEDEVKFESQ